MRPPLHFPHYHCAEKGKQSLKEPVRITSMSMADLTEKQCRANKIAARRCRSKHWSDDFGND
jgi:hypothetical protein